MVGMGVSSSSGTTSLSYPPTGKMEARLLDVSVNSTHLASKTPVLEKLLNEVQQRHDYVVCTLAE